MNREISQLHPQGLWEAFAAMNEIPRGSKKEEKIVEFVAGYGRKLGLDTQVDHVGNVLIKKEGTPGYESASTLCLQAHIDMVHQKNESTVFDFDTQGIQMLIDEGWVKANGTTLGADNGIGASAILAVLRDKTIAHPPIEALFTVDEETGMTGAMELSKDWLKASYLLNLDTEDEDEIDVGCAGGIDISGTVQIQRVPVEDSFHAFEIVISGLRGGHSGMDIHRGFANANLLMNSLFEELNQRITWHLASIRGGGLRNAIPRESRATICVDSSDIASLEKLIETTGEEFKNLFADTEPNLNLQYKPVELPSMVLVEVDKNRLVEAIKGIHNGVYKMQVKMPDTVETSNNIAKVWLEDQHLKIDCLCRSAVETEKMHLSQQIKNHIESLGFSVDLSGAYPGWEPKMDSPLLEKVVDEYKKCYQKDPQIVACHAGLECGLLGSHYPQMEMISFGPNIRGAHSPQECVEIKSVEKFWEFLVQILASFK
jgi:dipeptidase D